MSTEPATLSDALEVIQELKIAITGLQTLVSNLEARVQALTNENESLKAQLGLKKTSSNSSIPPSHDIARKNQSLRERSGRKNGGQVGHEGSTLTFSGIADAVVELKPTICNACGADLTSADSHLVRTTHVFDVEFKRKITARKHYEVTCTCGLKHAPAFEPPVRYGATITALAGYMNTVHYVSLKRCTELFKDILGVPISEGTIVSMLKRCAEHTLPSVETIRQMIENADVAGADETHAKCEGKRGWFWIFQTPTHTLIVFDKSRSQKLLERLFPDGLPNTFLVSDRYAVYANLKVAGRQLCLAHLLREVNYLEALEKTDWSIQLGAWLRDAFKPIIPEDLQQRLDNLLAQTLSCATPKTRTFLHSLKKNAAALTAFLYHEHVPPDNNASERGIRHIKCKTKICTQFKTAEGARNYATLWSVIDTARKNGQSAWQAFLELTVNPVNLAT